MGVDKIWNLWKYRMLWIFEFLRILFGSALGRKFKFGSARCLLLRDEDFFCSLDVLYGGPGISKLQFLEETKNFSGKFCPVFGHQNPGSGSGLTKNAGSGSALKPMRIYNTDFYSPRKKHHMSYSFPYYQQIISSGPRNTKNIIIP